MRRWAATALARLTAFGRGSAAVAVAAAGAAALGLLAASLGARLLLVLGALALTALLVWRPYIGVLALVASIPLENTLLLRGELTATRFLGIAVLAAWLARKIVLRESWSAILSSSFVWAAALFWLLALASTLWARFPSVAVGGASQLLRLVAFAVLLLDLLDSWQRCDRVVKAAVAGGVAAGVLTIQQAAWTGAARAGEDIAGGVNTTAVVLVTLVPFAFYLVRTSGRALWRVTGIGYVALAATAVALTYSRMNLLLLPAALGWLFWQTLAGRRGRAWLLTLSAAAAVAFAVYVPPDRILDRLRSIGPYIEKSLRGGGAGEPVMSARAYHLRVGLEIARDHPILGVGYGNYGLQFLREYQYRVPGAAKLYLTPRSPHSSHVGILADLGVTGLVLWLSLIGIALANVGRARILTRRGGPFAGFALAQATTVALVLHATAYGFYLPNQREKILWVLLALSAATFQVATHGHAQRIAATHRPTPADRALADPGRAGPAIAEASADTA